jgi:ammonia channel protein AmtB
LKGLGWTMGLRLNEEEEDSGLDLSQHNETGYNY